MVAMKTISVRGFDFGTSEDDIRAHCAAVGRVVAVELRGKGGAFVTYSSQAEAMAAVEELQETFIEGNERYIDVSLKPVGDAGKGAAGKGAASKGKAGKGGAPLALPSSVPVSKGSQGGGSPTVVSVFGFDFGTPEEAVRKHCSIVGKVLSVQLKGNGGSALVTYASSAAAEKAVHQLAETVIAGNQRYIGVQMRGPAHGVEKGDAPRKQAPGVAAAIKPSKTPKTPKTLPVAKGGGKGNATPTIVNVFGFDFGTSEEAVRKHCSKAGKVLSVQLKGNGGSALVTFASSAAAEKALDILEETIIEGNDRYIQLQMRGPAHDAEPADVPRKQALGVAEAIKPSKTPKTPPGTKGGAQGPASPAVVNVLGFDFGTTEQAVRKHCSKVGKVLSVELKGQLGGSAFVTYASSAAAQKAVEQLNETVIPGNTRYISVKHKSGGGQQLASKNGNASATQPSKKRKNAPEDDSSSTCSIYVRGFDKGTSKEDIIAHCSSAGSIVESKMMRQGAVLTYKSPFEAKVAVDTFDKSIIEGNTRYIDVVFDQGKTDGSAKRAKVGEKKEKEKGPSGPELARELITGDVVTGTVVRFRGKSGFIKPTERIEHPAAGKHKGELYVHVQDVVGGEPLERGMKVQFVVYVDESGLGAEGVTPLEDLLL